MKTKLLKLLGLLIIAAISLISVSCSLRSELDVDLEFAESIEITYINTDDEESCIVVTDETDVNVLKAIFSGTAILSGTEPYMCFLGPPTDLKFIGATETFIITIDCHGTIVPQDFEGDIHVDYDEWEMFKHIFSKYITDISTLQDWYDLTG